MDVIIFKNKHTYYDRNFYEFVCNVVLNIVQQRKQCNSAVVVIEESVEDKDNALKETLIHSSSINKVSKKKKLSPEKESPEGAIKESSPPPLRFDCPLCDKPFKTLILLQQHVDICLV